MPSCRCALSFHPVNNRFLLFSAFLCVLTASSVALHTFADAQNVPTVESTCRERMQSELIQVADEYRTHVFGSRPALTGSDSIPLTGGSVDKPPIQGILETRGRLTSELVTPLVDSYRVLRCRALSVCSVMQQSFETLGGDAAIAELGCPDVTSPRFGECYLKGKDPNKTEDDEPQIMEVGMISECQALVESTLQMERAILGLAVSYDAGYRANLQLAGMHDWMMKGLSKDAIKATAGTVNMLGKLHQIPCFIGQCDAPDTEQFSE